MAQPTPLPTRRPLVGDSRPMNALRARIRRYGRSDAPILILGETGVGKDVVADAVHGLSSRYSQPFVPVNCGAIPRDLVEAELFGNVPGAFTGARSREGWFRRAHGGTLFLDEIGDLPLAAQVVLLRALETGRVWPIGAERPRNIDVRLVCATHRNLNELVRRGLFREDLYHRLAGLTLSVPPLRERVGDLRALVTHFFGDRAQRITPCAWARMETYGWPGNVRELRNTLNAALVEAEGGPVLARHLNLTTLAPPTPSKAAVTQPLRTYIARYVVEVFSRCEGNVRATARTLEVSPTTVYRYLSLIRPVACESL